MKKNKAYFHLPGMFEHYEFYRAFLPLYEAHPDWFYAGSAIGSLYGAPSDCLWGGGRVEGEGPDVDAVLSLTSRYGISARLTFSNSLLEKEHLSDKRCNQLCKALAAGGDKSNGVIVCSDLLLEYLKETYPQLYFVSSTTKVLTETDQLEAELRRCDFRFVVPDFRLNKSIEWMDQLPEKKKEKIELLCNECCDYGCKNRKKCYEDVSRKNLGIEGDAHHCQSLDASRGYLFSKAMDNPAFISRQDIDTLYLPMGINQFKVEGRGLGSAILLEFILYYMVKPYYHIHVREALYLDSMLDLF